MNQYIEDRDRLQIYLPYLRACAGLSMEDLAKRIGITKQGINYIEHMHQLPEYPEKHMTKMQYICIRAVFEEEYYKNPQNINLRDCYDLVFSDHEFYKANEKKIKYALYQMVEDTKNHKKKSSMEARKSGKSLTASSYSTGATAATLAAGGIAAMEFPLVFPAIVGAVIGGTIAAAKEKKKNKDSNVTSKRASQKIIHSDWMSEAFEHIETKGD